MRACYGNCDGYLADTAFSEHDLAGIKRKNPEVGKVSGMVIVLRFVRSSGKSSKASNQQALCN
jgi:hypothetical protein